MEQSFPTRPDAITPDWLTDRMKAAGVLSDQRVTHIDHTPIGTGQVGDSIRFTLTYDRAGPGPPTIAGKFASSDQTSRATAQMLKLYLHEVCFYRDIARDLPVLTPQPIFADIADDNGDFAVLMEDMGPARQGNQLDGCSLADARLAMIQAADLHGPTWRKTHFTGAADIAPDPQIRAMAQSLYPASTATFIDRYSDDLPSDLMAIAARMGELAKPIFTRGHDHKCLVHGDFRLDNMLFEPKGGAQPLAIVDWQTLAPGDGAADIGYFLGAGVGSELRRSAEAELLELYCAEMARHGVRLSRADIDRGYKMGAVQGVTTAVFSAANVVRTERGDANFLSMAKGALELVQDTGALSLFETD